MNLLKMMGQAVNLLSYLRQPPAGAPPIVRLYISTVASVPFQASFFRKRNHRVEKKNAKNCAFPFFPFISTRKRQGKITFATSSGTEITANNNHQTKK